MGLRGPKPIDISGEKFGKLTPLYITGKDKNRTSIWKCKCECGGTTEVRSSQLRNGTVKSCGCLSKVENPVDKERLFKIWSGMKGRCNNPNNIHYDDYGGRGIKIYEGWATDYTTFREWAYRNGYKDDLSIDRIDNNGSYTPENCRWITMKEQQSNKRNNVFVEIDGRRETLAEWSRITGIGLSTLHYRYKTGKRGKELIKQIMKLQLKDMKDVAGGGV